LSKVLAIAIFKLAMNLIYNFDKTGVLVLNSFANSNILTKWLFKIIGEGFIYIVPLGLLILWFYSLPAKKVALRATLSGLLAWLVFGNIIGRIFDRPRPFSQGEIHELVFHRPTYSFPSDHASFLFALTTSFYLSGYKRVSYVLLGASILVSIARIGVGAHYPTDTIAGALLGVLVALLVQILDRYLQSLYNFLIRMAQKLHLA
jgi:undecaprenyl-diphosphatase